LTAHNDNYPAGRTMPDIPLDDLFIGCIDPPSPFAPTHVWLRVRPEGDLGAGVRFPTRLRDAPHEPQREVKRVGGGS